MYEELVGKMLWELGAWLNVSMYKTYCGVANYLETNL